MEEEIKKHSKNIFTIASGTKHSILEKAKDIAIEIVVIVIAVSISIGLHNWNEERHNRQEEREFLTGLKKDIQSDIENMESSKQFYERSLHGLTYIVNASSHTDQMNDDSVLAYQDIFFSSTSLQPHIERYEGLKNSGKFSIIEDKELLNMIINLHEVIIERIQFLNNKYDEHQERFGSVLSQHLQITKRVWNIRELLQRSDIILPLRLGRSLIVINILPMHTEGIQQGKEILALIDAALQN
jgi:hypothetical protein